MNDSLANSPLLTVVVPVYKTERYLNECIESLVCQTLSDIEIILVDDGSPDQCFEICNSWAARDPRIRVVHKENQGLGFARNTGIELANGHYITFIDSDDTIAPDAYMRAIDELQSNDADIVRFSYKRFIDSSQLCDDCLDNQSVVFDNQDEIRNLALCLFDSPRGFERFNLGGSACTAIYKLDIINSYNIRFVSERRLMSEDYLFNFDYYRHCSRVVWLNCSYYRYRINPKSLTRSFDAGVMSKVENYCCHVERMLTDENYGQKATLFAAGYYVAMFRYFLHRVFLNSKLTIKEKHRWFEERTADRYFRRVCQVYPSPNLPLKQRVLFAALSRKLFFLSFLLITVYSRLRRDKLR